MSSSDGWTFSRAKRFVGELVGISLGIAALVTTILESIAAAAVLLAVTDIVAGPILLQALTNRAVVKAIRAFALPSRFRKAVGSVSYSPPQRCIAGVLLALLLAFNGYVGWWFARPPLALEAVSIVRMSQLNYSVQEVQRAICSCSEELEIDYMTGLATYFGLGRGLTSGAVCFRNCVRAAVLEAHPGATESGVPGVLVTIGNHTKRPVLVTGIEFQVYESGILTRRGTRGGSAVGFPKLVEYSVCLHPQNQTRSFRVAEARHVAIPPHGETTMLIHVANDTDGDSDCSTREATRVAVALYEVALEFDYRQGNSTRSLMTKRLVLAVPEMDPTSWEEDVATWGSLDAMSFDPFDPEHQAGSEPGFTAETVKACENLETAWRFLRKGVPDNRISDLLNEIIRDEVERVVGGSDPSWEISDRVPVCK